MWNSSDSESSHTITEPDHKNVTISEDKRADSSNTDTGPTGKFPKEADPEKDATSPSQRANPEMAMYTTALDWEGPKDPQNPRNWPMGMKMWHTCIAGLQAFTVTFGTGVYTPGVDAVMQEFDVSTTVATLPFTLYVIALGFGPMLSAPVSETYGRRFVYLYMFPIAMLFLVGAGCAQNIHTLIICRFFAAAFGAGPLAVGAGTMLDMFSPVHLATAVTLFTMLSLLGPALSPVIGGYTVLSKGWRWTQWLIVMCGAISCLTTILSRETYKKIILKRRAKKHDLPPPADPSPKGWAYVKFIATVTLFRPLRMLCTEFLVASLAIYTAFNFGVLYGFFAAFPTIYESPYPDLQVYHFNVGEGGLVFLNLAVGVGAATVIFIWIDRVIYQPKSMARLKQGITSPLPPEERMYGAMVGSFLLPIGLFWFAWTARSSIHWIVPTIASVPFACGFVLIFLGSVLFVLEAYGPMVGASAVAATGLLRYILGACFPLFTSQMYRAMGVGWATSLFGFVTVAMLPLPWVFYKYGPRLRKNSAYIRTVNKAAPTSTPAAISTASVATQALMPIPSRTTVPVQIPKSTPAATFECAEER